MGNQWRTDGRTFQNAPGKTVIHAEDKLVASRGEFTLSILHAKKDEVKGFLPSVRLADSCVENGPMILGSDDAAYEKALTEGNGLLLKNAEVEASHEDHHRHTGTL